GYVPIYGNRDSVTKIFSTTAQPIENTGKIYTKDHLLYQVEVGKGLHIINIADPAQPVKQGFINIMGIEEMAIVNDKLYANNFNDFITVNIADLNNPVVLNRISDAFHLFSSERP